MAKIFAILILSAFALAKADKPTAAQQPFVPQVKYGGPIVYSGEKPPIIHFPPPPLNAAGGYGPGSGTGKGGAPPSIKYVPLPHHDLPVLIYQSVNKPPIHVVHTPQPKRRQFHEISEKRDKAPFKHPPHVVAAVQAAEAASRKKAAEAASRNKAQQALKPTHKPFTPKPQNYGQQKRQNQNHNFQKAPKIQNYGPQKPQKPQAPRKAPKIQNYGPNTAPKPLNYGPQKQTKTQNYGLQTAPKIQNYGPQKPNPQSQKYGPQKPNPQGQKYGPQKPNLQGQKYRPQKPNPQGQKYGPQKPVKSQIYGPQKPNSQGQKYGPQKPPLNYRPKAPLKPQPSPFKNQNNYQALPKPQPLKQEQPVQKPTTYRPAKKVNNPFSQKVKFGAQKPLASTVRPNYNVPTRNESEKIYGAAPKSSTNDIITDQASDLIYGSRLKPGKHLQDTQNNRHRQATSNSFNPPQALTQAYESEAPKPVYIKAPPAPGPVYINAPNPVYVEKTTEKSLYKKPVVSSVLNETPKPQQIYAQPKKDTFTPSASFNLHKVPKAPKLPSFKSTASKKIPEGSLFKESSSQVRSYNVKKNDKINRDTHISRPSKPTFKAPSYGPHKPTHISRPSKPTFKTPSYVPPKPTHKPQPTYKPKPKPVYNPAPSPAPHIIYAGHPPIHIYQQPQVITEAPQPVYKPPVHNVPAKQSYSKPENQYQQPSKPAFNVPKPKVSTAPVKQAFKAPPKLNYNVPSKPAAPVKPAFSAPKNSYDALKRPQGYSTHKRPQSYDVPSKPKHHALPRDGTAGGPHHAHAHGSTGHQHGSSSGHAHQHGLSVGHAHQQGSSSEHAHQHGSSVGHAHHQGSSGGHAHQQGSSAGHAHQQGSSTGHAHQHRVPSGHAHQHGSSSGHAHQQGSSAGHAHQHGSPSGHAHQHGSSNAPPPPAPYRPKPFHKNTELKKPVFNTPNLSSSYGKRPAPRSKPSFVAPPPKPTRPRHRPPPRNPAPVYIPAPRAYHKPPIIIYQGVAPPVHVYEKPTSYAAPRSSEEESWKPSQNLNGRAGLKAEARSDSDLSHIVTASVSVASGQALKKGTVQDV